MKENFESIEKKELEPKLLFKLILMRHQATEYTDIGHDLTDSGVKGAIETGKEMKEDNFFPDKSNVISFHSPKPRAKGTLDFTLAEADISTENSRPIKMLRSSDIFDMEAFEKHAEEELGDEPARIAEAFYTHDIHKNHPEIIEPHLKKKKRLYRAMEYFIRSVIKNNSDQKSPVTQAFVVSHFEIITHLIDDVFGIENTGYRSPLLGEQVKISAFQTENPDKISLQVEFRGIEKQVLFNRKTRSIE